MPFAPVIDSVGPGIIMAQQKMQQERELANQEMLFNAMSNVASSIGSAVSSWKKDRERKGLVDGKQAAYETMAKTDPKIVDPAFVEALKKESNYGRKIGMIMAEEELRPFKQRQALAVQGHQMDLSREALAAQNNRTGQTTTVTDPVTGQKVGLYFQNNNQVAPFRTPTDAADNIQKVDLGNGQFAYFDGKGRPISKNAVLGNGAGASPVLDQRKLQLQQKVAALDGQMAAEPDNQKPGWDWWPFSQTFKQQRDGAAAELQSLTGGAGPAAANQSGGTSPGAAAAPVATTPAAAGGVPVVKTKAEFDALASGALYMWNGKKYRKP